MLEQERLGFNWPQINEQLYQLLQTYSCFRIGQLRDKFIRNGINKEHMCSVIQRGTIMGRRHVLNNSIHVLRCGTQNIRSFDAWLWISVLLYSVDLGDILFQDIKHAHDRIHVFHGMCINDKVLPS